MNEADSASVKSDLDRDEVCHKLRGALYLFRESHETLQDPDASASEAKLLFKAAEEKVVEAIELLTGKRE